MNLQPPTSTLFPYTTLFRSISADHWQLVFDHQPARNRPGGVEDQVADTVTEHRCLPVGLADDHPLAHGFLAVFHHDQLITSNVYQDVGIAQRIRQPAPSLQVGVDLL